MEKALRHGRIVFIYDTQVCRDEADDPADAVCFFYPDAETAPLQYSHIVHLVCQLMGTALFTERNMGFPGVIRLQMGEFVLHRDGVFIWAMHTSGEDETYVTRRQLMRTCSVVDVLHGGLARLLETCSGDRDAFRGRLHRTLYPIVASNVTGVETLARVFGVLPQIDWARKDDFIGTQLRELESAVLRVEGVLQCVTCWDGSLVSGDAGDEMVGVLLLTHGLEESCFGLVDTDQVMPAGVTVAHLYVPSRRYTTLLEGARTGWQLHLSESDPGGFTPPLPEKQTPPVAQSPGLDVIREQAGLGSRSPSSPAFSDASSCDAAAAPAGARRRRRRRLAPAPNLGSVSAPASAAAAATAEPGLEPHRDPDSARSVRSRISSLALQAISAEFHRQQPPSLPSVDNIPIRRVKRTARGPRARRAQRSLSDMDVPEPFSNLAYLKRKQPDLYRAELRKLKADIRDNQPAFSPVTAHSYSFGIPRSNRLYTPQRAGPLDSKLLALPPLGWRRTWRGGASPPSEGAGYISELPRAAGGTPRAEKPRFFSDTEAGSRRPLSSLDANWRARLRQLPPGGQTGQAVPPRTHLLLYTKARGRLRLHVLLQHRPTVLPALVQRLEADLGRGLRELEGLLSSFRTIPSFHGHHYSYAAYRPAGTVVTGGWLQAEGASHLDIKLLQMIHADFAADSFTDLKIRTPSDVLLAQRLGGVETYYQQQTSGHQYGLPVVNGPLSKVAERARRRLEKNHGLTLD